MSSESQMTEAAMLPSYEKNALGERARQRVVSMYSLDVMVDSWVRLVQNLAGKINNKCVE